MRVAIVHDWLNTKSGGAERVLEDILKLYPEADLYALLINSDKFAHILIGRKFKASFLRYFPGFIKKRPQFLLPFVKLAVGSFKLRNYDLVISSSGAWVKNINVPKNTKHICYCYTPARMLWVDWPSYLDSYSSKALKYIPFARLLTIRLVSKLRIWDFYGAQKVDEFIAISDYVAARIKKFYGRDARVVYPGVSTKVFLPPPNTIKKDYFLVVSTLARYKNIDQIVRAFNENNRELIIVGDGSESARLKKMAKSSKIKFAGFVTEQKKADLLIHAQAFMFASIEDFGIAPVEALAAATPVIALAGGGVSETVTNDCGIFFETPAQINEAIEKFTTQKFTREKLIDRAKKYDIVNFKKDFVAVINESMTK